MMNAHLGKYRSVKYCTELYHFNFRERIEPDFSDLFWEKFKRPDDRFEAITLHNHEEPELLYMTRGTLFVNLDGEDIVLRPGDLMLIDPFEPHTAQFDKDDDVEYRYLVFDTDCLAGSGSAVSNRIASLESGKLRFRKVVRASDPVAAELGGLMDELGALPRETEADDLMAVSLLCRMTAVIFSKIGLHDGETRRDIDFIKRVSRYIDDNYAGDVTTASVSDILGYSKTYFCALFRKNFDQTFSNYLMNYRLERAMTIYRNSRLRLSDIAEAVGFGDYCYFSRRFRQKTGISPSEYFRGADERE